MVNIAACETCNKSKDYIGTPGINVKKGNLTGDQVEEELVLTPDVEKGVDLNNANLQLKITLEVQGGTAENASLAYEAYDVSGNPTTENIQGGKEKIGVLSHFYKVGDGKTILESTDNSLTKKFTFKPDKKVTTKMVATFQLINNNREPVGSSCTSTWLPNAAENIQMEFTSPLDNALIKAQDAMDVDMLKHGDAVKPSEIEVELVVDKEGFTFDLGHKKGVVKGTKVALNEILNDDTALADGDANVPKFQIKNRAHGSEVGADVTLKVYHKEDAIALATKNLKWKLKEFTIKFTRPIDNTVIAGATPLQVQIEKEGEDILPADLTVEVVTAAGFKFTLGAAGEKANTEGATLQDILGDNNSLDGKLRKQFYISKYTKGGADGADVALVVRYGTQELARKLLKWNGPKVGIKDSANNIELDSNKTGLSTLFNLTFVNHGDFDLSEEDLKKIKIEIDSPTRDSIKPIAKGMVVSSGVTTLGALLGTGNILQKGDERTIKFNISNLKKENFTIRLVNAGTVDIERRIIWKP